MNKARIALGIVIVAALSAAGYWAYGQYLAPAPATPTPPAITSEPTAPEVVSAEGVLIPAREAALAFRLAERVAEVLVAEGDHVSAGQPLIRLEHADLDAAVAQAQAGVTQAQAVVTQARAAVVVAEAQAALAQAPAGVSAEQTAVGEALVQQAQAAQTTAKAAFEAALAGLSAAKLQLEQTFLVAPFAGTVVDLGLEVGELATPGVPVLRLADLDHWQMQTSDLAETDVVLVRLGQAATITLDALAGVELAGTVTEISEVAETNRGNVTYAVTVALDPAPAPLRWGMTAFADIHVGP